MMKRWETVIMRGMRCENCLKQESCTEMEEGGLCQDYEFLGKGVYRDEEDADREVEIRLREGDKQSPISPEGFDK